MFIPACYTRCCRIIASLLLFAHSAVFAEDSVKTHLIASPATPSSFGYSGLVLSNGEVKGSIRLKTSALGLVTGTLTIREASFVLRGSVAEGFPTTHAARSVCAPPSASLSMQLRSVEENARLEGEVLDPNSPPLQFWAERVSFGTKNAPVSESGRFTGFLKFDPSIGASIPAFTLIAVNATGRTLVRGGIGNSTFTAGTQVDRNGTIAVFANSRRFPVVGGKIYLRPTESGDVVGDLVNDSSPVHFQGAVYRPVRGKRILGDFDQSNGFGVLRATGRVQFELDVNWTDSNRITVTGPGWRMFANPKTGYISGTTSPPDASSRLRGVCVQQTGTAPDLAEGFIVRKGDYAGSLGYALNFDIVPATD